MPKRPEVDAWFARYDNPKKDVVMRIRDIVLSADPRIDECIKWQAPTFMFEGNLASFFPKSKEHASLMFHTGAQIPGSHPRLEGGGGTSRVMKIASMAEADAARGDLERVVRAWCEWRGGAPAAAGSAPRSAGSTGSAPRKTVKKAAKKPVKKSSKRAARKPPRKPAPRKRTRG